MAALADRQHGVVARRQLLAMGVGARAVDNRIASARLRPLHAGVYAVGHRVLTPSGRMLAAVLAGGPGAVLSHRSAAQLWGMRRGGPSAVEVTVPNARRGRPGLRFRTATLADDEITTKDGIRTTGVSRTLLDLAAVVPEHELRAAANRAEILRLADPVPLAALLERHPRRRGAKAIRALLTDEALGKRVTRSELEDRFLGFCVEAGLPRPATNSLIEGYEVDCVWREQGLIVELDGHASHATRAGFESDRARDRALQAAGWRVARVTWRQLVLEPERVERDLRRLLGV